MTNSNLQNNENAFIFDFAKEAVVNASRVSEKAIDANLECALKSMSLYESAIHTIDQQLLNETLTPEKEDRLETQKKKYLQAVRKIHQSTQKSICQSRRSYYWLTAGLILALVVSLFLLCQFRFSPSSALDNPEEVCYTELYDNHTEDASMTLPE